MYSLINGVSGVKYDYIEHMVLILGEEGRRGGEGREGELLIVNMI